MAALSFSGCRVDLIVTLDEGRFQPKVTILLAASVFHYRILSIRQVKEHLRQKGLTVIL
jgi:imidazole glycerol phosphate synthase subunit HisF